MGIDVSKGNPNMDYRQHERTYHGFIKGAQIGTAAVVIILLLMLIFLV